MNTHLNTQQIEHYRREGFAVHENLLTKTELTELRTAVDEAVAALGKKKVAGGEHTGEDGDGYYDRVFTQKLNLWKISPVIKRFMLKASTHITAAAMVAAVARTTAARLRR